MNLQQLPPTPCIKGSARALSILALAASGAVAMAQQAPVSPAPVAAPAPMVAPAAASVAAPAPPLPPTTRPASPAAQVVLSATQPAIAATQAALSSTQPASQPTTQSSTQPTTQSSTQPTTQTAGADGTSGIASTQPVSVLVPTTQSSTRPAQKISLEFKDTAVDAVLDYLSEAAGFIVVKEVPVDGRVTVVSRGPVTSQEALTLLNAVLKPNGFTAIQQGRVLKIVKRETAKKQNIPVMFGADPEQIPETDELVTQVIPVKNIDATKLRQDLQPLISADADFAANQGSNSLILTDTSANIRRVAKIVEALDKHEASASDMRIVQLKFANATSAAKLITSVFAADQNAAAGANLSPGAMFRRMMFMGGRGGGAPGAPGGGGEDSNGKAAGKVTAAADDRTNTLVITAPTDTLKLIDDVLKVLDSDPSAVSEIRIFQLKFANAASAAKLIATVFGPDQNNAAGGSALGGGVSAMRRMSASGFGVPPGGAPAAGGGPGSPAPAGAGAQLGAPGAGAGGGVTGKVTAASDDRTNTLVVAAPSETLKLIAEVVKVLDSDSSAESEVKIFPLKFANAASTAKLIMSVFAPSQSGAAGSSLAGGAGVLQRMISGRGGAGGGAGGGSGRNRGAGGQQGAPDVDDEPTTGKVSASSDDRTNSLVVAAPTSTLKLIADVVKVLDSDPSAVSEVKVFQLKFADSVSSAKLINTIFNPTTTGPGSNNTGMDPNFTAMPRMGAMSESLRGGRVTAASDDRTNSLVVTAPPEAMTIITGIVSQLDSNPMAETAFFIYHLRNAQSANLQTVLNSLFGAGATGSSTGSTANRSTSQTPTASSSGFGSSGGSSRGGAFGGSSSSFGSALTSSSTGSRTGTSSGTGTSAGQNTAYSELTGKVFIVAEQDTNSLLVTTASKYQAQVKKIIEELDRPVPQVLIKVLVAEVTHERTNDFGIDFSILNTRPSGNGTTVGQNLGNAAAGTANGGLVVSLLETNLNATLHALATEGKLDVLSRPYILASDNQLASITIGQEVPFITNTQITDTGQQINTITYQAVGIILNVTPHINPDGVVTLDVAPQISQLTGTTVPIGLNVSAPVIANRSAQSRVAIRNGNTIVIGGMMQDQKTTTINKIPLLGDIPYLGQLFTRYEDDRTKTELLIFLTPHVALEPDSLKPMSEDEIRGTKTTPNAVEPGVFDEHMKGMQRESNPAGTSTRPAATDITSPSTQPVQGIIISAPASTLPSQTPPAGPTR